ncbi:MAG: ATP-binding protein, partial [Lachnospiraceae bacterium]|nr:ATP-binding protein [Lachnospiraceae bacterium]
VLNDLERLTVKPEVTESIWIERALRQADFKNRIRGLAIPECLVMADRVRFVQVADNIISNSYKYADTEIEVRSFFDGNDLCICIRDFGQGVKKEEEIFLAQKYFRGQNAGDKEGSGMGMYIAEYLVKAMGGRLCCRSVEKEWFEVTVWLVCA